MARISDIRSKDRVSLKDGLSSEDVEKLRKFVKQGDKRGYDLLNYFENKVLSANSTELIVEETQRTEKSKTEFAVVKLNVTGGEGAIRFKVQTRYLKLLKREPKHPVTSIFA